MNQAKYSEFVTKLIDLTQSGKINWLPGNVLPAGLHAIRIPTYGSFCKVFTTEYKEKILRLTVTDNFLPRFTLPGTNLASTKSSLELLDSNGELIWKFPIISSLDDLADAIEKGSTRIDEYIDDVLGG